MYLVRSFRVNKLWCDLLNVIRSNYVNETLMLSMSSKLLRKRKLILRTFFLVERILSLRSLRKCCLPKIVINILIYHYKACPKQYSVECLMCTTNRRENGSFPTIKCESVCLKTDPVSRRAMSVFKAFWVNNTPQHIRKISIGSLRYVTTIVKWRTTFVRHIL